jgi:SAM-dependent methyltransferase
MSAPGHGRWVVALAGAVLAMALGEPVAESGSAPLRACDLCGGAWEEIGRAATPHGGREEASGNGKAPLLRCRRCGSLRLDVSPAAVIAYLERSRYNDPEDIDTSRRARSPFLAWICDRFLADLPPRATVVDFGASFGHLGELLMARGHSVIGVEVNQRACRVAEERLPGLQMVADLGALAPRAGTLDAIVALDSLYYVDSPRAVLGQMAALLRPGGRLLTRNTNGSLRALAFRLSSRGSSFATRPLGDACWGFSIAGFTAAVETSGFEVATVAFLEVGKQGGWRGLYYRLSGIIADLSRGRLAAAPGWLMVAVKR